MWQGIRPGIVIAALAMATLCLPPAPVQAEGPAVIGARIGQQPGQQTRFVLDLTAPARFDVFLVPDPYRAVIDLSEVEWRMPAATVEGRGLISAMRYGLFKPGTSRVVLDLTGPAIVAGSFTLPRRGEARDRVVVDLRPASREEFMIAVRGNAAPAPPKSRAAAIPPPPRRNPLRHLIAIDAGHGGVDPGAVGADGTFEKDVTLAAAKALRDALLATGRYEVMLTRDTDVFVALRDRFKAAQAAGAEAFISLHADILSDRRVRGATVYTLSETSSDAEAAALAARENKADMLAGVDLSDHSPEVAQILIELSQRVTMNASAVLAREMVDELRPVVALMHNTHRFAGFAVLKSPEVPSVLIEMGYLSNRADERRLRDARFRAKLAAALTRGLDRYFANQQALKRP